MKTLARFWQVLMVIGGITPSIKWLVKIAAACLAAAALFHSLEFWSVFSHVLLAGGLLCLALFTMIWLLMSPYQLLCLVTSKPLGLLPGIRAYSFAALSVINLGCSIFISQWVGYVIYGSTPVENPLQIFLGVVLYISVFMSMTTVFLQIAPPAAGFMGAFIWCGIFIFNWFMRVPGVLLVLAIVMVWGLFGLWWFRLRVKKRVQNIFLARTHPALGVKRTYWWRSKDSIAAHLIPRSLFEEVLFGRQIDIWVALKRGGWVLLALLFGVAISKSELLADSLVLFILLIVMLPLWVAMNFVGHIVFGLKNIWLLVSGGRRGILGLIERRLFQELWIIAIPYLVFIVVILHYYNPFAFSFYFMLGMAFCLFSVFVVAVYGSLFAYLKKEKYRKWCPIVAVTLGGFMSLVLDFVAETRSGIYLSLFFLVSILLAYCLRLWVLRLWPRVNLLQERVYV